MQNLFTFLFLFLFFSTIIAQDFTLTVNDGTGSGSYFYGDTIHVFSNKASGLNVFTEWSGSGIDYLQIADEWHTRLVVPTQSGVSDLVLDALYDQLPLEATETMEMISLFGFDDGEFLEDVPKEVYFSIPENPKGMVFLFHGTGGQGANMFSRYEPFSLVKDLYYKGYGCISTDANERTIGDQDGDEKIRWIANQAVQQDFDNNIDLYNIRALRDTFVTRYNLPDDFLFYSYGISNGANFSDLAAAAVGFQASAHNTAHGSPSLYAQREDATPVIWVQSVNDQNESANSAIALANYQALLDRGICSEWYWLEHSPLYEKRFMRSRNNIGEQKSMEVYNRFLDYPEIANEDHFIIVENIILDLPDDFYDPLNLNSLQINDVEHQMKVANADHGGNGDFNKTIIRFFENNCVTTAVKFPQNTPFDISVFPNPTNAKLEIVFPKVIEGEIFVSNITGQLHFKQAVKAIQSNLDLSGLANGIYLISLQVDGQVINRKIVLQK